MFGVIFWSLAISVAINGAMFLIAFRLRSDKLTDASYAVSFITLALFAVAHGRHHAYDLLGAGLVCLWALRIGSFLLYRVMRSGTDERFDGIREHFWRFGKFWLGQALTVWLLMIPLSLATGKASTRWAGIVLAGVAIWAVGFVLESIADFQKYRFTHNPAHRGQWIDSGVWHYSRHPNYFGEMLIWVGIYAYAFPNLSASSQLVGAISPLWIITLLLFISGIPILEKSADKHWGSDPAYRTYKRRTSVLIPLPKLSKK